MVMAASFSLAACSSEIADTGNLDPSKLSEELEKRAQAIEEKADMAAVAAERDAGAELVSLREAEAAESDQEASTDEAAAAPADSN
jgi:hypothetical protein